MREPIDDLDPDLEEQTVSRRRERLMSPRCPCGAVKGPGHWLCEKCFWEEQEEIARLNPPRDEDVGDWVGED